MVINKQLCLFPIRKDCLTANYSGENVPNFTYTWTDTDFKFAFLQVAKMCFLAAPIPSSFATYAFKKKKKFL